MHGCHCHGLAFSYPLLWDMETYFCFAGVKFLVWCFSDCDNDILFHGHWCLVSLLYVFDILSNCLLLCGLSLLPQRLLTIIFLLPSFFGLFLRFKLGHLFCMCSVEPHPRKIFLFVIIVFWLTNRVSALVSSLLLYILGVFPPLICHSLYMSPTNHLAVGARPSFLQMVFQVVTILVLYSSFLSFHSKYIPLLTLVSRSNAVCDLNGLDVTKSFSWMWFYWTHAEQMP